MRLSSVLLILVAVWGMGAWAQDTSAPSAFGVEPPEPVPEAPVVLPEEPPGDPVDVGLQLLDLRGRIAQLMLVTLEGLHAPSSADKAYLRDYGAGGVVVPQILEAKHAANYITETRGAGQTQGIPLLLGANLYELVKRERGAPSAFVQLPTLLSIAATGDVETAGRMASVLAEHMRVMGFNIHLGPSLALAPTLEDAPGPLQCLGSDPVFAAEAGWAILEAFREKQVFPVAMGFPGGGYNRRLKSEAVLLTPRPNLNASDLAPYIRAIEGGVSLVHVGNTLVPTLDSESGPASLSKAVMRDLLRDELAFSGVIIAGPLDHPDVAGRHDPADAARMALENGADMLYVGGSVPMAMRMIERLQQDVIQGRLDEILIDTALERVIALKRQMLEQSEEPSSEREMAALESRKEFFKKLETVERQSITLAQNRNQVLPLSKERSGPVGVCGVAGVQELQEILEKRLKHVNRQPILSARHAGGIQDFEIERITGHLRGIRTIICILTDTIRPYGQVRLVEQLKEKGVNVVVLLLGYPRYLDKLAAADAILLGYCDADDYGLTLKAMADVLIGEAPLQILDAPGDMLVKPGEARTFDVWEIAKAPAGRLPVTISERFPVGLALPYLATESLKKAEWDFGTGKRVRKERTEYAFESPGRYPVTLTVTDSHGESVSRTFQFVVRAE